MCNFEVIATTPPAKPDSDAVNAKLAEIRDKSITRFEPIIRPDGGLTYTGFFDQDFARQLSLLKTLQELGIVKEEAFDYVRKCQRCGHHGLLLKVSCPVCGSTNTDQGKVIEHLPCGNIDLESKFIGEDAGGLICPKCKKRLKAIGVDYVKPGSYCKCFSCNALSPEGKVQFVCLNCASKLSVDDVERELLYAYSVDSEAVSKHLESSEQVQLSIVKSLEKLGVKATSRGTVIGSSQVQHTFDIVAYQGDNPDPALIVEIEKSDRPIESETILNYLAKSMDCRVPRKVLIGIPSISEEAKKLANAYAITLFESDGSNLEELAGRLAARMGEKGETPGPDDSQLADVLQSIVGVAQEEEAVSGTSDVDSDNLERMLRTIINAAQDEETDQDVS